MIQQQIAIQSKLLRIILVGILSTVAFNVTMYVDVSLTGLPLDIVELMGSLVVGDHPDMHLVGHMVHTANGIGLTLLFAYVVIPLSRRIRKISIVAVAVVYAVMETIVAVWLAMLPMLGAGIGGLEISPLVPLMTMSRHVVFGLALGISWKYLVGEKRN